MVVLQTSVGKREVAPLLRQNSTHDGWPVPSARTGHSRKKNDNEKKKVPEVVYDYNFVARGEDAVKVYNAPYDEKFPVVCIRKRSFDIENPTTNAWVGNLHVSAHTPTVECGFSVILRFFSSSPPSPLMTDG